MKTNNKFLLFVFALLIAVGFTIASCEKSETVPSNTSVLEKRGGGGGNNPNSPNYNPCLNYPVYPIVNLPATDWNITLDTTVCGTLVFRWNAQPKFNPIIDSCYTIARYYYVGISGTNSCNVGNVTSSNSYYYTLGAGCSVWPGGTYVMGLSFYERNTVDQKVYVHSSLPFYFTAPTRAPWLGNCL